MSKHDTDNRANQLNPNNSAYASSRGLGGVAEDDDDDDDDKAVAGVFPRERVPAPVAREVTAEHVDIQWPESIVVRYVTSTFENGTVLVHVRSGQNLSQALRDLWSTGNFVHLSCNHHGRALFAGDRVEELTDASQLERGREALANSIGKTLKKLSGDVPFIAPSMLRNRECDCAQLPTYAFR